MSGENEIVSVQEEGTKPINLRFPVQLLKDIEAYQESNEVPNRTQAIMNLLEIGLHAVNEVDYVKTTEVRELPCTTIRELQVLSGLKRMDAGMKGREFAFVTMNELKELDELILSVSTILQNLNYYKDRMKEEGYTALADMGQLAYEKL